MEDKKSSTLRWVLGGLLVFGALNAFGGGIYGLAGAPDVPRGWLVGSPFHSYFVPSLILLVVVGGSLLAAAVAVLGRWRADRWLAASSGVIVLAWLAVELAIIGYVSWMQPVTAIGALAILALATQLAPARSPAMSMREAASRFLALSRIAVTGVSRTPATHGANVVYRRLRERGYRVFAVNPNAHEVEGDRAYPDLRSIPGGVDAVVIATRADRDDGTMRECIELGIKHAWMHRAFGDGSVSHPAAELGRAHGIAVIEGGCPCMFAPTADPGHEVMRFCLTLTGRVPRHV